MKNMRGIVINKLIITFVQKRYLTISGVSLDARKKWKGYMLLWCS